jgi:hypothetical protein
MTLVPATSSVRLRQIALPIEHGGWGLLATPLVLGLWVAPSPAGGWLAVAAFAAFLARQPLRIALADRQRGTRYPRTAWAERLAAGFIALGVAGLVLAWLTSAHGFLLPLIVAAPLAVVQFAYDLRHQGRALVAEVCGATSLGSIAAAITMAAGWPTGPALVLWMLLSVQAIGAILYVSARLRLARGVSAPRSPAWLAHALALALAVAVASAGHAPWLAVVAFAVLSVRAVAGLWPPHEGTRTTVVGFQEVGASLLTVVCLALGYRLGW